MSTLRHHTIERLIELAEPVCADLGYELVDLDYSQAPQGWVVRVFIDYPPDTGRFISFTDCEALSRELSALFDVEDPVPHAYSLEVSSPGVDRPLRKAEHFRRALGEEAKVALREGISGRRNFRGRILQVDTLEDGSVVTMEVDGVEYQLPLADLATAKLVPDWNALMKGTGTKG